MPIVLGLLAFLTVVTMVIGTVASFGFLFVAGLQKTYTAPKPSALSSSFSTYGGTVLGANCGIPEKIRPLINRASKVHDIDAAIIAGIMKQESAFNPGATSGVGAAGLMQLMPETYTWLLGVQVGGNSGSLNSYKSLFSQEITNDPEFLRDQTDQRYNPGVNAYLGTLYVKYLLGFPIVKGNVNFALAAYNAGQGNVEHYGGIPPFAETINYVKVVSQNISQFKSCLEQKTTSPANSSALDVPAYRQGLSDNCVDSARIMTEDYFRELGGKQPQQGGGVCYNADRQGTAASINNRLNAAGVGQYAHYEEFQFGGANGDQQALDAINSSLDKGAPVVMHSTLTGGVNHTFTIVGFDKANNTYLANDPASGAKATSYVRGTKLTPQNLLNNMHKSGDYNGFAYYNGPSVK